MEGIMTQLADASRRDLIAAVASVAAAASAAQDAQAQTPSNLRFFNPTGMSKPTGYSQVVEINGPHRTIYLAGQTGIDANGKLADGFRAQAVQVIGEHQDCACLGRRGLRARGQANKLLDRP
jgi:hypothetical protein